MRPTIRLPARCPQPNDVPYPAAAKRVKKFLKDLLQKLWDTRNDFVVNIGPLAALKELARQFDAYARQEPPFTSVPNSDTLSWWRALASSNDANVLAVCHPWQV